MEHYLDMLFSDHEGYVALAAKGDTWEEQQFAWPRHRNRLVWWVNQRIDEANIFVNPALRSEKRRSKGDGINLQWLWADIDWEKVTDKPTVMTALRQLKPALVNSGTETNLHVYVQLANEVSIDEHYRLNHGLKDLLEADAKHPDNSLLRLPGTYNRKGRPVEVTWRRQHSKVWTPQSLRDTFGAIRDTVILQERTIGDGTYYQVSLEGLPGYARRVGHMSIDEALERYGSRHGAVYQVTMKLIKLGLNRDQIHTALEEFQPGIEKQDDEQGYDLHRDIDRCIGRHPTLDQVLPDDEEEPGIIELSDEEYAEEAKDEEEDTILTKANQIVLRRRAEERARQIMAFAEFTPPPYESTVLFSDALVEEPEDTKYLISGLASVGDNVSITGQYKAGKTLFVCNLVRSLAAQEQFLGSFDVDHLGAGTVGFWSLEMTRKVLEDRYLRPQGWDENEASNLVIWHGRGYSIPLTSSAGRQWTIDWLRQEMVTVWVIDSFARICAMSGVETNDNDQVLTLLKTLDEIKREANVSEMFLIAHTGRGIDAKDRARGATVFDDWADARWILSRDTRDNIRSLKVEGRDVELDATTLVYDTETKHLTLGTSEDTSVRDTGVQAVVAIVAQNPGIIKTTLTKKIKEQKIKGYSQNMGVSELIEETVTLGFIRGSRVNGRTISYSVVPDSMEDGITVDFTNVKARQTTGEGRRRTTHV